MNCLQSDVNKMLIFIGMLKRLACPKRWSKGSTIFVAFGSKMGPKSSQWCCMPFKQASQQSGMGPPFKSLEVVSERNKMHFSSSLEIRPAGDDLLFSNVLVFFWIFAFWNKLPHS